MKSYILNQNELQSLIRYELLYKWKQWQEITKEEDTSFSNYLLKETPYQPEHEFIQNLCKTKEEKEDPVRTGIYKDILPADVARYQARTFYKPSNNK